MKKVAYLTMMFVALTLMSFSCSKDDDDPIVPDFTAQDLLGNWNFVSLDFNGTVYDTPDELTALNVNYDLVALNFNFTASEVTYSTTYVDAGDENPFIRTYDYTFSNNIINCDDQLKFQVVNASTFNNTVLKLKLTYCSQSGTVLNGTYTLER